MSVQRGKKALYWGGGGVQDSVRILDVDIPYYLMFEHIRIFVSFGIRIIETSVITSMVTFSLPADKTCSIFCSI